MKLWDSLSGSVHPLFQESRPPESAGRHALAPGKTLRLALPLPFTSPGSGHRLHCSAPPRPPPIGHKGRFVPTNGEPWSQSKAGGGPPASWARALAGSLGQQTGQAVYTGREGSSSATEGTGDRDGPAGQQAPGGACISEAPAGLSRGGCPT